MELTESEIKRRFQIELSPFFEMLAAKNRVSFFEWQKQARQTAANVIQNPDQYLGPDRPSKEITAKLITEVFEEFIKSQRKMTIAD